MPKRCPWVPKVLKGPLEPISYGPDCNYKVFKEPGAQKTTEKGNFGPYQVSFNPMLHGGIESTRTRR